MKRRLYYFLMLAAAILLFQACDNGNADVTIFDSPPAIDLVKPVKLKVAPFFTSTSAVDFDLKVKFRDGADPAISSSPLASATYQILDANDDEVVAGNVTLSGVAQEVAEPIDALPKGSYKVIIKAVDTNNNSVSDTTMFKVVDKIGIIGSATPGGWGADTDMVRSSTDTDVYTGTFTLVSGEAKFRADDDWAINWGAATPLTGVGVQDGSNIPVTPGTYDVTFNIATGAYKFTLKP